MSYPDHVARRRRQLGLPVTPFEHVLYEKGESPEPAVTYEQMARTLRDVLPRARPGPFRDALLAVAARIAAAEDANGEWIVGPAREPGEEG